MSLEVPQKITGHTELLGLIAYPIRHSGSPRMHNLALAELGLNYAYLAFEVDLKGLKGAIDGFRVLKVRGWNVSMPNKMEVIKHLDKISLAVELIGACNTVVNDAGVLTAENTDGLGYIASLREAGIEIRGRQLTLMGIGGAGSAIAVQAALEGAKSIEVFNRRDEFFEKGVATAGRINSKTNCKVTVHDLADSAALRASVAKAYVLANATCVGFKGELEDQSPLADATMLRKDLIVSDTVYAPLVTRFLGQAAAAGCKTVGGIPMMLHQGATSFRMWTGKDMPLAYVTEHLAI